MTAILCLPYYQQSMGSLTFERLVESMIDHDPALAEQRERFLGLNYLPLASGPELLTITGAVAAAAEQLVGEAGAGGNESDQWFEAMGRLRDRARQLLADHEIAPNLIEAPLERESDGERLVAPRLEVDGRQWVVEAYLLGVLVAELARRGVADAAVIEEADRAGFLDLAALDRDGSVAAARRSVAAVVAELLGEGAERHLSDHESAEQLDERGQLVALLDVLGAGDRTT